MATIVYAGGPIRRPLDTRVPGAQVVPPPVAASRVAAVRARTSILRDQIHDRTEGSRSPLVSGAVTRVVVENLASRAMARPVETRTSSR
jgi:hypothetical protein